MSLSTTAIVAPETRPGTTPAVERSDTMNEFFSFCFFPSFPFFVFFFFHRHSPGSRATRVDKRRDVPRIYANFYLATARPSTAVRIRRIEVYVDVYSRIDREIRCPRFEVSEWNASSYTELSHRTSLSSKENFQEEQSRYG